LQNKVLRDLQTEVGRRRTGRDEAAEPPERRRLFRLDARRLATDELLAIVLGPGGSLPARQVARGLLDRYPEPADLARQPAAILQGIAGVGRARAARLRAACELGFRLAGATAAAGHRVRGPEDLTGLLRRELGGLDRENFLAIHLDARHRILAVDTVSVGTLNASLVHPREVFRPAVGVQAAALVVAHNHPSGCARPSGEDLELTRRLSRCGRLLGIELLDHLVVGDDEVLSIREYGWPAPP
jgi:DNA repair protein RadC